MVNVADMTHDKERGLSEKNISFESGNPRRRKIFYQEFKYYSKQGNNNDSYFTDDITAMSKRRKLLKAKKTNWFKETSKEISA